jgi:multidrug efflux pump subunit AcrA (membrane-fusion protein)
MAANPIISEPESSGKRRARLRALGVLVLLLGLAAAGVVYWTSAPPEDWSADPATARAYKTETRDIEINFGKMGILINDLVEDLQYPGTQAAIIAAVSVLVASGCFFFAQWPESDAEPDDPVA